MGVFVNFKDYHGKVDEALTKLLTDLKKFGSQAARNIKPETLAQGYGEDICHIIDELLNIELYRREYQFHQPIIPDENDESSQLGDENLEDDPNLHGVQEINGIQIQTQEDTRNLIGGSEFNLIKDNGAASNTNLRREITRGKIEETKIGFFNPSRYEEQEALFEKAEENQILQAQLDPLEWRLEVETVVQDLRNIEKEIELSRQRGNGMLDDDIEEHRREVEMIIELCKEIQNSCGYESRKVFSRVGEKLEEELETIRKHETRINKNQQKQISTLNNITQKKKGLATDLRAVIDRVKKLDYESKDLSNALHTKEHDYEEKMRDASGTAQISKLKKAIAAIKQEVKEQKINEGTMHSVLYSSAGMRRGKHLLFDELAEPAVVKEKGAAAKNDKEEAK